MAADLTYIATLDDSQVLKALQNIDRNIDKMSGQADKNFQSIGKSASSSGLQIGAMAGVVTALAIEFINLGKQAAAALIDIGEKSAELAAKFEVNKGFIKNIFEGDEEAANAVIDRLVKRGAEIGLLPETAVGLGVSFLPDVSSTDQLDKFIESAVKLKQLAPERSFEDIRQALEQAISGDLRAFQDRLNLPKEVVPRIKELQTEFGNATGLLKGLDEVFSKFGVDLTDISDTAIGKFGEIQAKLQELQLVGGEQFLNAVKPILDQIIAFLTDNREELILFAASLGDAAGSAAEFIASLSGLDSLTPEKIVQLGQDIFAFVEGTQAAGTLIGQFLSVVGQLLYQLGQLVLIFNPITVALEVFGVNTENAGGSVSEFIGSFFKGEGFFQKFLDFLAQASAGLTGLAVILGEVGKSAIVLTDAFAALATGDVNKAIELNAKSQEIFNNALQKGQQATRESYQESRKVIDDYSKAVDTQKQSQDKLAESLDKTNEKGKQQADDFLAAQDAAKKKAEADEKLAEAQKKVAEETAKAEKDFARKLEDIDIATERKRLDIAIEFAQKREDAAKNNLQKLADLRKKNSQDVDDAAKDLNRKEEDIARKFSQERIDLERDNRQKRVDIEKSYRETLQGIQSQFLADAEESERKRDAVGFLRAVRERDKKVKEAQDNRTKEITETQVTGELKRQELALQQQRELEEAAIANERKLEDLKTNLNRQIEEQNTAYARQLDDLMTAEARKNEELNRSREQDIEDAKLAYERKLEDLKVSLAAELEIIAAGNAAIEAEAERHAARMEELAARQKELKGRGIGSARNTPTRPAAGSGQAQGRHPGDIPGFASGGTVPGPRGAPMLAMVHGGERIIPNSPVMMPAMSPGGASYNVTNNNQRSASLGGLLDASNLDAMLQTRVQNILLNLLGTL